MLLHSHTDGPNAIEGNGPNAIVAIGQYLTRLPRRSLPRSVMILLTTGHFAGGAGVEAFVRHHRQTTLRRTAATLKQARDDPGSVLRPYVSAPGSPDGNGWPAEGAQLWTMGALPTTNCITGPTYLLNCGIPTLDKLDVALMRREAMAFTEMLLTLPSPVHWPGLSRVPKAKLRTLDLLPKR